MTPARLGEPGGNHQKPLCLNGGGERRRGGAGEEKTRKGQGGGREPGEVLFLCRCIQIPTKIRVRTTLFP